MELRMHPGLQKVAEFMQETLPANELASVAEALGLIAPVLWGRYAKADIAALALSQRGIAGSTMGSAPQQQGVANVSALSQACAGGGSVAAGRVLLRCLFRRHSLCTYRCLHRVLSRPANIGYRSFRGCSAEVGCRICRTPCLPFSR